jgi:type II secretion system protein H
MKFQKGFTLLELLAVLFIMGLVLTIVVPTFGPMTSTTKLKTASQNLADVMDMAQQHAITTGRVCYVVFPISTGNADFNKKTYKVVREDATNTYVTVGKVESLPKGIEVDNVNSTSFSVSKNIPFPEDNSQSLSLIVLEIKSNGAFNNNGHIQLKEVQGGAFQGVYFYNQPIKVLVKDIGV